LVRKYNKVYTSNRALRKKLIRRLLKIKARLKSTPRIYPLTQITQRDCNRIVKNKKHLYNSIRLIRLVEHHKNKISSSTINNKKLRYFYVRYADDWVVAPTGCS
jgi:hypothetical protein